MHDEFIFSRGPVIRKIILLIKKWSQMNFEVLQQSLNIGAIGHHTGFDFR